MDYIKQQTDYDGVSRWHAAGYTGAGITIWDAETARAQHGQLTRQRILDAAPDVKVINASLASRAGVKDAILDDGTRYTVEDFVQRYRVKIITRSVGGRFCGAAEADYWLGLQRRHNLIIINSAGNEGSDAGTSKDPVALLIGACGLYKAGGRWELRRDNYSSVGPGVDFVDFRGDISVTSGTSFAAPYLAGKIALLCQRYGDLTQVQAVDYLRSHAQDMQAAGRDNYTGWGLPLMGDVDEVFHGEDVTSMTITMRMGSLIMDVDGKKIMMDEAPCYNSRGDRMMVPVKFVAEAFGCETVWDEASKTVMFIKNS